MRATFEWVRRAGPTELPVLIQGETGSGKERIARAVHETSRRADRRFVAVNCAALPESLLEAELFGCVRGAYTGADRDRQGLFRIAHRGTLFLDEIGEIPLPVQGKLLRAIEERRVRPVGGSEDLPADARLVAATHRNLRAQVAAGLFRSDLYYRLGVVEIPVPPLRARSEDLPGLVADLGRRLQRETGLPAPRLASDAWRLLREHDWPGNVRELHSLLARATLRAGGSTIRAAHLPELAGPCGPEGTSGAGLERSIIRAALRSSGGSISAAAREIGWTRQKLYRRMKALAIDRPPVSGIRGAPRC